MKEKHNVEFKTDWDDKCLKSISAFANSGGGKIYIGLNDKGEPVGLKETKELLEVLPNKIKNRLGINVSIKLLQKEGKEYLEIDVKPSNFAVSYEGKFYIRSGSTNQVLEGQELASFLLEKSGLTWDEINEDRATFADIDILTVEKFKTLAKDKIPSIEQEKDWRVMLEKLKVVEKDKIKRAAILLFGKNPQKLYSQAVVKVGRFKTQTEILFQDIIEGNLFEQLNKSLDVLRAKYLVSRVEFKNLHREEILEYPYEALREAIINALIHRDYTGTSHIQIRVYDDKLVIMNEGKLPPELSVEKLKSEHISKPRNPLLASVFYFSGFIEAWGRGTLKIIEAFKKRGLPEPEFENDGVMKVIFYKDIYTEENLIKLGLNERQIKAILYVKEKGKITNREYQKLNSISRQMATIDLRQLVERGILKMSGKAGKGIAYLLPKLTND